MARLTDEQAALLLAYAKQTPRRLPGIEQHIREGSTITCDAGNGNAWALLVLDLLDRVERAEADCRAMAAALTPVPPALIADGTALVWAIALDAPTDAVVRRWKP